MNPPVIRCLRCGLSTLIVKLYFRDFDKFQTLALDAKPSKEGSLVRIGAKSVDLVGPALADSSTHAQHNRTCRIATWNQQRKAAA